MNENEILTLGIDINDDPLNQKVEAIEGKITTLQEKASSITMDAQDTNIPGYAEAIQTKLDMWNASLTDVVRARKAIDQASNSVEQADLTAVFRRKVEMADRYIEDIQKSVGNTQNFVKDVTPAITNCLNDYSDQLKTAFRTVALRVTEQASKASNGSGSGMLSDKELINEFLSSSEYKSIAPQIQKVNPQAATGKVMSAYLQSQIPIMLPQYVRSDVAGNSAVVFRTAPTSFREIVPPAYGDIPTKKPTDTSALRKLGSTEGGNERLTKEEQEKLDKIIQSDHRAADAAVAAGIYGKSQGKLYYNPNTIRDMVNAMGGANFAENVVVGARGHERFGIHDVEDPSKWRNISKKLGNNNTLDSGRRTAWSLSDSFPWHNPGYYDYADVPQFDPSDPNTPKRYVGQIHHSPREIQRGFAEYTLDMMDQGVQITGNSPVKNQDGKWIAYPNIHEPQQASKKNGFVSVSPDDFHTIGLNGSMLMDLVHSMPHASSARHNDFDDSMIYLKHDERLGNQYLPAEEKAALRTEIESRLANGYDANGKHYIPTRISKTHTEFMWDKIVDDIGRYELGMPPDERPDAPSTDEIRKKGLEVLRNGAGLGTFDNRKDFAKAAYNANLLATDGEDLSSYWGMKFGFQSNDAVEAEIARRKSAGEIVHPQQEQRVLEQLGTPNTKVVVGHFETADGTKIMDGANWAFNPAVQESFQGRSYGGKATYVKQSLIGMKRDNPEQIVDNDITRAKIAAIDPSIRGRKRDEMVQDIMMHYGDFVIPGAGMDVDENGVRSDLIIPWDTDFVEADDNIKNKALFKDENGVALNQQQLNEKRSRDYSRWHVSAKTTYNDAGTSSRWLSKQVVNGQFAKAFQNPNVEAYFAKTLQDEISHLDDEQYARDVLFGGDQTVDLTSEESQKVRENHINNLIQRYSQGDRLLPTGVMSYSMAAPNPQNVINEMLMKSGQELTPLQQQLHLGEHEVVSPKSGSKLLSIIRFPATLSGNIKAANLWNSNEVPNGSQTSVGAAIRASFARRGLDEKGLYFNPASSDLGDLQGMDFDGDKTGQFDLSSMFNIENLPEADRESFTQMIGYLNASAQEQQEELMLASFENMKAKAAKSGEALPDFSGWTKEQKLNYVRQNRAARRETYTERTPDHAGRTYDLGNPSDMVDYLLGVGVTSPMMGQADRATDIIAALYDAYGNVNPAFAQALLDHEDQYDVVSTHLKTAEKWANTEEQKNAASFGRSFARIFEWAAKDVTTAGENDDSSLVWDTAAQMKFNDRNFDQINLPTINNGAVLGTLRTRMKLKQNGQAINGTDQYGNALYDWNTILDSKNMPTSEAEGTEGAKLTMMLRKVKAGFLNGDYLALSKEDEDAIAEQRRLAAAELAQATKGNIAEYDKRWRAMGGNVAEHIGKYSYTQRAIESSPELKKQVEDYAKSIGVPMEQIYSTYKATEVEDQAREVARTTQQQKEQKQEAKQQAATNQRKEQVQKTINQIQNEETKDAENTLKTVKSKNAEITTTDKIPPIQTDNQAEKDIEKAEEAKQAQAKAEQRTAEARIAVAQQEQKTATEEARHLLSQKPEAGKKLTNSQINSILSLPRENVAAAVTSGDWKQLLTNGIGQTTAEKAIALLKDSRYANYQPSSSPELGWKIAPKTPEQKERDALVATETVPENINIQTSPESTTDIEAGTKTTRKYTLRKGRAKELKGYSAIISEPGYSHSEPEESTETGTADGRTVVEQISNKPSRSIDEIKKELTAWEQIHAAGWGTVNGQTIKSGININHLGENGKQYSPIHIPGYENIGDYDTIYVPGKIASLKDELKEAELKQEKTSDKQVSTKPVVDNQTEQKENNIINPPSGPNQPPSGPNQPPSGPNQPPNATTDTAINSILAQLAQAKFGQIMQGATDFSKQLYVSDKKSEAQINETPAAIQRLDTNMAIARGYERQINEFRDSEIYKALPEAQRSDMDSAFSRMLTGDNSLSVKAGRDFMSYSLLGSKNLVESISKTNDQMAGTYDPQIEALQKWEDKIKEVEAEQKRLQELSDNKNFSKKVRDEYAEGAENLKADLERLKAEKKTLDSLTYGKIDLKEQAKQFQHNQLIRQGDQLARSALGGRQGFFGRTAQARSSALTSWENYKSNVDARIYETKNQLESKKSKGQDYSEEASKLNELQQASDRAGKQIESLSGPFGTARAAAAQFGNTISNVITRFGRQFFNKALQETKRFIKEYESTMTQIQMITLKSDSEMSTLGDGLIAKAKELKISFSEIAKMSTDLYRQGLSDEEMNERLDVIAKFSKVSGTKATDATKLITTAMNTGLVDNAQYAADVVTMLGDSAATNAAQIEKGIEKAGAAAAVDGTSYGQLVALLTAVTATTQVTGNVAGTTLNSIFGRMNKVGTNELIYDENGNTMSGSAIAKLLRAQGIETNNTNGTRRSTFDMLYDLAQKYDTMSDDEQRQIATAISGTRQFSNFGAIMTGIKEGEIDKYLELINGSEGITDKKYDIYAESLQASLDNLKNTWDALVKDLIDKGVVTGFIDGITTMIQGVDNLSNSFGNLKVHLPVIMTLLGAIAGFKLGGGIGALIGAGAGIAGYGILTAAGVNTPKTNTQLYQEQQKRITQSYNSGLDTISKAKELRNKGSKRTDEENAEYGELLYKLANRFNMTDILKSSSDAAGAISDMAGSAKTAADNIADLGDRIIEKAEEDNEIERVRDVYGNVGRGITETIDKGKEYIKEYNSSGEYGSLNSFYKEENGQIVLNKERLAGYAGGYYSDTEKQALANALANAGDNGYLQGENKKTSEEWLNYINERMPFGGNLGQIRLSSEVQEGLKKQIEHSKMWSVNAYEEYYNQAEEGLTEYFKGVLPDPSTAKEIAHSVLSDYRKQYGNKTELNYDNLRPFVNEVIGYTDDTQEIAPGRIEEYQKAYEKKKGITATTKEDEAVSAGLEYLGEGTYYIGSDGKRYSFEEATKIEDQYRQEQQKEIDRLAKTKTYYYTDKDGNKIYKNDQGEYFKTDKERNNARDQYALGQNYWQASFTDYNTGKQYKSDLLTKEEADIALADQYENSRNNAFKLRDSKTRQTFGDERFSSRAAAELRAAELNNAEQVRYAADLSLALAEQLNNTTATYTNLYGETFTRTGAAAHQEVDAIRQKDIENSPYVIIDSEGKVFDTAKSPEEAEQKISMNLNHYTDQYGFADYGVGREGRAAWKKAHDEYLENPDNYEYSVNGLYFGRGEAARDAAYAIDGTWTNKATGAQYGSRQEAIRDTYSQYVSDFNVNDYGSVDELLEHLASGETGFVPFDDLFEYEDATVSEDLIGEELELVERASNAAVVPIETIISSIQDVVPELENVKPAQVLEVWGRLPSAIQTTLMETGTVGENVLGEVEATAQAVQNEQKRLTFKAYQDIVSPKVAMSSQTWQTANQQKLYADQFMSMIQGKNISSYEDFLAKTGLQGQQLLVNMMNGDKNGELGNILSGAVVENGEIKYEEEGLYTSLVNWIMGKSSFGGKALNRTERAAAAEGVLDTFLNKDNKILLSQEASDTAYDAYLESIRKPEYEAYVQQLREEGAPQEERYTRDYFNAKNSIGSFKEMSYADWKKKNNIAVISEDQKNYLKEFISDEEILKDIVSGNASPEIEKYARQILNNAQYGISGLTTRDKYSGIQDVIQAIDKGQTYNQNIAAQYMSGFANWGEYSELLQRQANGEAVDEERLKTYRKQLDEYLKDMGIEIEVEGLSDLEQAGELLEGTAKLIKDLQSNNTISLKAKLDFEDNLYNADQTHTKLINGSYEEQIEAMRELGVSENLIDNDFVKARETALQLDQNKATQTAATLDAVRRSNPEYANILANAYGYELQGQNERKLERIQHKADREGYTLDVETGEYKDSEGNVVQDLTNKYRAAAGTYAYTGGSGVINYATPGAGAKPLYTASQIVGAQNQLLNAETISDANLRAQAIEGMGEQLTEYMRMKSQLDNEQSIYEKEKDQYSLEDREEREEQLEKRREELEAQRTRAEAELEVQSRSAANEDRLKELKSSGDMFGYALEQRRQNNKGGIAADAIYESLSSTDVNTVDDLLSVLSNKNNAQSWKDLFESSPEVAQKISDMGLTMDKNGDWDTSGLISSTDDASAALSALAAIVREASDAYTHEDQKTTGEKYQAAMDYINGTTTDEAKGFAALSDIFGQGFAEDVGSAYQPWKEQHDKRIEWERNYDAALASGNQAAIEDLKRNEVENPGAFDYRANMSEYDKGIADMLVQNAQFGQYGLTDVQKYDQMQRLFETANTMGGIAEFRNQDEFGFYDQFVNNGSVEGFGEWTRGVEALNAAGIELKNFNAESKACQDALGKAGIAVNSFAEDNKNMAGQVKAAEIEVKKLYGENSSEIANRVRQLSGGAKSRAEALKEMAANEDEFNKTTYARNQWQKGKKNYGEIASAIGQSKEWVKNAAKTKEGKAKITQMLDIEWELDQQKCVNDAQALVNDALSGFESGDLSQFNDFLVSMGINGEYDISNLAAVADQAEGKVREIIDALIAACANISGEVTFGAFTENGNTLKVKSVGAGGGSGGGYSGGGGGGGGGSEESEASKAMKLEKHKISEAQHKVNMVQIKETHYEHTNEYEKLLKCYDKEIDAQKVLQAQYQSSIAALNAQLAGVEAYTDDWYSLKSAVMDYEEKLQEISNTIDEINAKKIDVLEEKQENEDKPETHKSNMLSYLADRYKNANEYSNYNKTVQDQIDAKNDEISANEAQIAEWEALLKTYKKGSEPWITTRDNIWKLREENAEKKNEALELQETLNSEKVSQVQTWETRENAPEENMNAIATTYADMYSKNEQYGDYRNALNVQNLQYERMNDTVLEARKKLLDQMAGMDNTSEAWYEARDAVYAYDQELAANNAAIDENNRKIEQSKVNELTTKYDRDSAKMTHELAIINTQKEYYEYYNDYEAVAAIRTKERGKTEQKLQYNEFMEAEMVKELSTIRDPTQVNALKEKIYSVRETIASTRLELEKFDNETEKIVIDGLLEKFGHIDELDQHQIKMVQYQETRFQNNGELTNYGNMLRAENELQQQQADHLSEHIEALKDERKNVETGTEEYYKLEKAIMKYEEQLQATTNTIYKNNKLLEENNEKIRQTQSAVENIVDKEIRARIQKSKQMLAAEVNMQNTILDVIRKRYQDEFALETKRINKLKDSLNQEKSLINERLNARKNAVDQAEQYEELAEYKRQLALLSADPTRTKEAKELQKRIEDMERSMAYDVAAAEASAEGERIDDQIQAYDQYLTTAQEDLNMMLQDSEALMAAAQSDFGYNVAELMAGSWTDLLAWLQENNVNYRNATDELQTQMVQGWRDTWEQMYGIINTYWDQVEEIMSNSQTFMDYMMESDTYKTASEVGQRSLYYTWSDKYDDMVNALKDGATYEHIHDLEVGIESKIDEARDWTYTVQLDGASKTLIESLPYYSDYKEYGLGHTPVDTSDIFWNDLYSGVGKKEKKHTPSAPGGGDGGGGGKKGGSTGGRKKEDDVWRVTDPRTGDYWDFKTEEEANNKFNNLNYAGAFIEKKEEENPSYETKQNYGSNSSSNVNKPSSNSSNANKSSSNSSNVNTPSSSSSSANTPSSSSTDTNNGNTDNATKNTNDNSNDSNNDNWLAQLFNKLGIKAQTGSKFASGGLVDYTGPAWVDGSFDQPEAFLDPEDTKNIAALTDILSSVSVPSLFTPDLSSYGTQNNQTIGDVYITINQADLTSDQDIELVAKQVGEAFSKQLSKQGFNLTTVSL